MTNSWARPRCCSWPDMPRRPARRHRRCSRCTPRDPARPSERADRRCRTIRPRPRCRSWRCWTGSSERAHGGCYRCCGGARSPRHKHTRPLPAGRRARTWLSAHTSSTACSNCTHPQHVLAGSLGDLRASRIRPSTSRSPTAYTPVWARHRHDGDGLWHSSCSTHVRRCDHATGSTGAG